MRSIVRTNLLLWVLSCLVVSSPRMVTGRNMQEPGMVNYTY